MVKALEWYDHAGSVAESAGVWSGTVLVTGDRGQTSDTLTGTLYGPDDDTVVTDAVAVDRISLGYYRVTVTLPDATGLFRVKVEGTDDYVWQAVEVTDPFAPLPTLEDVKVAMGATAAAQYTDAKITEALAQERSAQLDAVDLPETGYTRALRRALIRRVQVNLAQSSQVMPVSDGEGGVIRPSGVDPVVRAIERRYPRSPVG